jgi:Uncharacterized protein conserved in bacteria (DUF2330)
MRERKIISAYTLRYRQAFVLLKVVLLPVLLFVLARPAATYACGIPLEARIPSEQALIVFTNGREEIITSVQLLGDKPGAAVIFPVPGVPTVGEVPSETLFTYLAEATRPQERIEEQLVWRDVEAAGGAEPRGVSVLGQAIIGGYSVARLAADDAGTLQDWLDQNGYRAPDGAAPILRSYIDAGWKFVAVKLAPGQRAAGALKPLRMAFDSPEIVYPMRLGALADQPLDVLLYVLADHRVDIAGMETQYAGPIAGLGQAPPADLAPLFKAPYLTRLGNNAITPATITSDFVARPAPTDEPFRKVVVRTVFVNGWDRMALPIIGLILVVISSSVAFGIAFGLQRRMNQIAGPNPEEDDD